MADTQRAILRALLHALLDRGLIVQSVYDSTVQLVNSRTDLPDFLGPSVCCRREETGHGGA